MNGMDFPVQKVAANYVMREFQEILEEVENVRTIFFSKDLVDN